MNVQAQPLEALCQVRRLRFELSGVVQGVGFRPHAYRCATSLGLSGTVLNHGNGVSIEVEGARVDEFESRLVDTLPALARIDVLQASEIPVVGERGFQILESETTAGNAVVPADVSVCDQCLGELFDPMDRRFLHPFIACSDCGPRYSMTSDVPYDRATTAMAAFPMCGRCETEYRDPIGRRLHAEPIACHDCGPVLSHSIAEVARALRDGAIVALKGVGGFHFVCDAHNDEAVRRLRLKKRRPSRPLAVMLLNIPSASRQVDLCEQDIHVLSGRERPIVICNRADTSELPKVLAPGLSSLGVMLPYTPVHYLLFHQLLGATADTSWLKQPNDLALVMTSANLSGEPMVIDNQHAMLELGDVADLIVTHNREIAHGVDDSVFRQSQHFPVLVRRGRSYAPAALNVSVTGPAVLAMGAHLKNTICAVHDQQAFLSPHYGDLESANMLSLFHNSAREWLDWLRFEPEAIACDLHPDYASSRLALSLSHELGIPLIPVQHHHAHIAAMNALGDLEDEILGVALDGHGMGSDGGSWGGECLRIDALGFERLGHFAGIPLPGGDTAAREPWRLAAGIAETLGRAQDLRLSVPENLRVAVTSLSVSSGCATTTAAGRYFDAAAAMLGLCDRISFEAEAPMRLEALCRNPKRNQRLHRIQNGVVSFCDLFDALLDVSDPQIGADLFHGALIDALVDWIVEQSEAAGCRRVALGGGCFVNSILASLLPAELEKKGIDVIAPWTQVTPGDGGISLGQAIVASRALGASSSM